MARRSSSAASRPCRAHADQNVPAAHSAVETRGPQRRIGIRIGLKARDIQLADNRIRGCATEVADLRRG
jgi:hypothetical protein